MKFRRILTVCFAGMALSLAAQTHLEGEEYFKADQFNNSKTLLERNLNNPGTDKGVSYYYMGRIALLEKKAAEAAKYFDMGAQANPDYPYNYVGLAQISLAQGDKKVAEENFKTAEKLGKKDAGVQIAIARAYYDVDPTLYAKEIEKRLAKAHKVDGTDPDIYIFEGDMEADQRNWGSAGAKYEMAVEYDPNATGAYVKYANLFRQVNPDYTINMLQKLLSVNPNSALGQRQLANAYYDQQKYKEAAAQYGKYVKNPNHFKEDEDRYAFLLFYDGDYRQGYDYATNLLKSNPSNFSAMRFQFMNAAQLKELEGQLLPMAESLYAAHKQNPAVNKFAPIDYTLVADEYNRNKRSEEAVAVLQEAIKEIPTNANFNKQLASIYIDLNDLPKAADTYAEYISKTKNPDYNDYVQQALYEYFAGLQDLTADPAAAAKYFDAAVSNANKAKGLAANQYKPLKILGDVEIAKADKSKAAVVAQPYYEEAIVLLQNSADPGRYVNDAKTIYNYLGNYYVNAGDKVKAKEYFNKYLELDPNNADYRKFVNSL
ncbi:MAG: tetratricopeptide repeat protein [Clostridium sp.]|nr:tetratricopeptide repeat protein [Prevotella sp.]MCM1428269.1 tetratricopeptide repeat protein [Clostridium sp.]MCM1474753.1 tetratricopeptide repeat protein [Muribaculaceae bacterium]